MNLELQKAVVQLYMYTFTNIQLVLTFLIDTLCWNVDLWMIDLFDIF